MTNDKIKVEKLEPVEYFNLSSIKSEKIEIDDASNTVLSNLPTGVVKSEPSSSKNQIKTEIKDEPTVVPKQPKSKKAPKIVNKDVCAICLSNFSDQNTGTPNVCQHQFCLDCIQEWAKVIAQFYLKFHH